MSRERIEEVWTTMMELLRPKVCPPDTPCALPAPARRCVLRMHHAGSGSFPC